MTASPLDLEALTVDAVRAGALRGQPVTVLGFARTGIALARFFVDAGAEVTVYDQRPAEALSASIATLEGRHVRLLAGPDIDPGTAWRGAALVTTSPSINPDFPTTEPVLRAALGGLVERRRAGDAKAPPIISEPDLFLRLCPAPTVGITGTKGKTTTSALTYALVAADPSHRALLGGNMGRPIVEALPELTAGDRVVYELSELQLPTLSRGTTVAVYTNVTADHLDRHGSLESYRRVKRRLAELVDPEGALVLNADDPVVTAYAGLGTARSVLYRLQRPMLGGVGIVDGWIVGAGVQRLPLVGGGAAAVGPGGRILPIDELVIPGRHNVSNAMAAVSVALLFGVAPDAIRSAAARFRGVEHRLETVAVIAGVRFVNDSQGTQPDAVIAALRAFEGPIVLIAGGRDKGIDLTELASVVGERAAAAVLIGESGPDLERLFGGAGLARIERADSLDAAVERAAAIAAELRGPATPAGGGASEPVVLLSPAAASFDMFADYEARGRAFKAAVGRLPRDGAGRAGGPPARAGGAPARAGLDGGAS